jgi:hypothetical protein
MLLGSMSHVFIEGGSAAETLSRVRVAVVGYSLHSPVFPSLLLLRAELCHHIVIRLFQGQLYLMLLSTVYYTFAKLLRERGNFTDLNILLWVLSFVGYPTKSSFFQHIPNFCFCVIKTVIGKICEPVVLYFFKGQKRCTVKF